MYNCQTDSHYTSTLLCPVNDQNVSKLSELGTSGHLIKGLPESRLL